MPKATKATATATPPAFQKGDKVRHTDGKEGTIICPVKVGSNEWVVQGFLGTLPGDSLTKVETPAADPAPETN